MTPQGQGIERIVAQHHLEGHRIEKIACLCPVSTPGLTYCGDPLALRMLLPSFLAVPTRADGSCSFSNIQRAKSWVCLVYWDQQRVSYSVAVSTSNKASCALA